MLPGVILKTDRLELSPVSLEDCNENYLAWLNDGEINQYLESGFHKYTIEQLIDFVKKQELSDKSVFLAIRLKASGKHIGNIKLDKISDIHRSAEYGILMGEKNEWGKGYAKEASVALIDYGFVTLQLRKIYLGVVNMNSAALRLYQNMGFQSEGVLKEHFFHKPSGNYLDEIRMALFNTQVNRGS